MGVCNALQPTPKLVLHKANKPSIVKKHRCRPEETTATTAVTPTTTSTTAMVTTVNRPMSCLRTTTATKTLSGTTTGRPNGTKHVHIVVQPSQDNDEQQLQQRLRHRSSSSSHAVQDDHERSMLWWTKEERRDILERNQCTVQDYIQCHPRHVQHVQSVFEQVCCRGCSDYEDEDVTDTDEEEDAAQTDSSSTTTLSFSSSSSSDEEEDDDDDKNVNGYYYNHHHHSSAHQRRRSALRLFHKKRKQQQQSHCMNLPACVRGLEFGILPKAKAHRKTHVRRVLEWQDRVKGLSHDRQVAILGHQATMSSQRSRRLAKLLAQADASGTGITGTTNATMDAQDSSLSCCYDSSSTASNPRMNMLTNTVVTPSFIWNQQPFRRNYRPRMIPSWR
mmetsp:Transcript_12902/g.22515  ORF Transcript_12902/g.22515 Transcript_12902/m.22515 type:complete len:390 (-) Transcript_12902:99-1268(-)